LRIRRRPDKILSSMTAPAAPEPLYPTRAAAGALLGRQLYQRCPPPVVLLGITPTGVEIAANAAQALSCSFDVIVGAHVRLEGKNVVGAIAEDADAVTDPDFNPTFGLMDQLHAAMDSARRAVKTERLLFRGQRPLRRLEDSNVVVVDGQLTSPWKALAAATAAELLGARKVWIAAAACTQAVQERIRARKYDLVCPSIVLDPAGHARPFGDPQDPSAERLRSIVVARQAA
jgi:predicted phosphoribosyltransferase